MTGFRLMTVPCRLLLVGKVLGISVDDQEDRHSAEAAVHNFMSQFGAVTISLGECLNADAFELALAMTRYGIHVAEIFGTLQQENYPWLRQLAQQSPDTRVYSNMEPTMLYYDPSDRKVNLTLGKDAGYYHPECPNVPWNEDRQPYGYAGIRQLFAAMGRALSGGD